MTIAWLAVGVVLIGVELHHLAFYALFGAVGCFAAAIVAVVAPNALAGQVVAAVIVAALGILLIRPRVSAAVAHRRGGGQSPGVHGGLVGQEVVTLDIVGGSDRVGHVRLAGESWLAISGADHPIPADTAVLVTAVRGTTLIVWPVDGQRPNGLLDANGHPHLDNGEQE